MLHTCTIVLVSTPIHVPKEHPQCSRFIPRQLFVGAGNFPFFRPGTECTCISTKFFHKNKKFIFRKFALDFYVEIYVEHTKSKFFNFCNNTQHLHKELNRSLQINWSTYLATVRLFEYCMHHGQQRTIMPDCQLYSKAWIRRG